MKAPSQERFDPLLAERRHLSPGSALAHRIAGGGAWETDADGAWVTLSDGRRLLDLGSYGVTLLGHRHPAVVAAVRRQLARLPSSSRSLANEVTPRLAARLVAALGRPGGESPLRRCWFGCNGADAVDLALKLARAGTGRPRVVAAVGGFHGKTLGALRATWQPRYREPFTDQLAATTHVVVDDLRTLERELSVGDVAALILEPIQGEGGVVPIPAELVVGWGELARAYGCHFLADEIQTGFHRCGSMSLALEMGAQVSAVLLGKALGGGVAPISAVVGTDELFTPLLRDAFLHTTTFGGHPLSAAAALAALEVTTTLPARSPAIEGMLERLRRGHPEVIANVRGRGYLWGVQTHSADLAGALLVELAAAGVIVSPCLGRPEVIRLLPPAVLAGRDRAIAEARLRSALRAAAGSVPARSRRGGQAR